MVIPINPYVAGNPVGGSSAFIGRSDVLREVVRILRRSQDNALVLYGQRRIGKTSILQHLVARLPSEGEYRPVYFDLQDKADWQLDRVLRDLAVTIAHKLNLPDPDLGTEPALNFRQNWLPQTLDQLPPDCPLILLMDEFDVLADPQRKQAAQIFFAYLRDLFLIEHGRLKFIFVIGRNVDDLDNIALSLFKGTPALRISLMSQEDTIGLVKLSESNDTLHWEDAAAQKVWEIGCGHPFLTQQLCSHVWERLYDEEPDDPPTVTLSDVETAIPGTLQASRNTLEWLWDGLPPAERVVASALAAAGPGPITQENLENLLHESGVRVVIRELQNAPHLLQEWDLIEPIENGYRFRVELLRRWIAQHKPLRRVQEDLDRVEPVAESYYQAALGLYRAGLLDEAVDPLRRAITLNPSHARAHQLLADILLTRNQAEEARQLLERLYEYQPAAARPRLVQALLVLAQTAPDDDARLPLYERVLELAPTQPEAVSGRQRFWQQHGEAALRLGDLKGALKSFRKGNLPQKVTEVETEMRRRELGAKLRSLKGLEQSRRYQAALDLALKLSESYAGMRDWSYDLEWLQHKAGLDDLYQRGIGALKSNDRATAQNLLTQVVAEDPTHDRALEYLYQAIHDVDLNQLQERLAIESETRQQLEQEIQDLRVSLRAERTAHWQAEELMQAEQILRQRQQAMPRLSPWNLMDYWRLIRWFTLAPQERLEYREAFGVEDERRVSRWFISALLWLPLILPALSISQGIASRPTGFGLQPEFYAPIALLLFIGLLITGWQAETKRWLLLGSGFFCSALLSSGLMQRWGSVASISIGWLILPAAALILNLAGSGTLAAGCGLIAGIASYILGHWITATYDSPLAGIGAGVLSALLGTTGTIALVNFIYPRVREQWNSGSPSFYVYGLLGVWMLGLIFFLWLVYFGGWQYF